MVGEKRRGEEDSKRSQGEKQEAARLKLKVKKGKIGGGEWWGGGDVPW